MRSRRPSILPIAPALALLAILPNPPALASDGALEIHQACVAGGCFPGDPPGFPVLIAESGSYVLTSNLQVPDENTTAIRVTAEFVTLDLGGFVVSGVTACEPSACSPTGSGVGIDVDSAARAVSVRNGVVARMGSDGVRAVGSGSVENLEVRSNGGNGIVALRALDNRVGANGGDGIQAASLIADNRVRGNRGAGIVAFDHAIVRGNTVRFNGSGGGAPGISCTGAVLVRDNVVSGNEGPGLEVVGGASTVTYGDNAFQFNDPPATPANQVVGGTQLGPNVCQGAPCL